jgi:lysyl-tRNA synthetase class 2
MTKGNEAREGHKKLEVNLALKKDRLEKLEGLRNLGIDPYPPRFEREKMTQEAKELFEREELDGKISLAGRIFAIRDHGKSYFLDLEDASGRLQTYFKKDLVGDEVFSRLKLLDIGDVLGVTGTMFRTRVGEITLQIESFEVLSKSLRTPPIVKEEIDGKSGKRVLHDSFKDKEQRYRQRYLDLMVNRDVRENFLVRSKIISLLRDFLEDQGFLEVETPILQPVYGGAFARPFKTFHNALGIPLYLRIANELYLKRLIIGGYEKVFEFSKDFRNEGIDRLHNPEFTQLELYAAYSDYVGMMTILEEVLHLISKEIKGNTDLVYKDRELSFKPPFERISYYETLSEAVGQDVRGANEKDLRRICKDKGLDVSEKIGRGKILEEMFDEFVESNIVGPTFVIDYPIEISPLAKGKPGVSDIVERFELIVCGEEMANAFSELNDPLEQRKRFEAQMLLREEGDEEAQILDEDFLRALEYGMPPTGGMGIGVDRLVMVFTNLSSIREVILFPQMRPEQ